MKRALLFVPLLLMLAGDAFAQITPAPELLNFQGRLAKPDGTPVADGTYSIRFSLWSAVSGGTEKWFQQMNPVLVKNGTFGVLLGNGNPITATVLNGDTYLEIKVGTNAPLSPRQHLTSVAYALKANTVPDGAITTAKISSTGASVGQVLKFNGSSVVWDSLLSGLNLPYSASASSENALLSMSNTGGGLGLYGRSVSGIGVAGGSQGGFAGVGGSNTSGNGVYGESTGSDGVHGYTSGTGAGVYGDSSGSGAGIYGRNTGSGLAADFLGTARMTGFRLTTNPQAGNILTSDGNGNGTWQVAPTNTGPQGQKGDKGDTGSQGPKGDKGDTGAQGTTGSTGSTRFNRSVLNILTGGNTNVPTGYNLISVRNVNNRSNINLILPLARSFSEGSVLVLVLEATNNASLSPVLVDHQPGDSINQIPSGSFDTLSGAAIRYYSDGVSTWYHW